MKIEFSPKAARQLKKLKNDEALLVKLAIAFDTIARKPYAAKVLQDKTPKLYSYRVEDWRILYEIYKKQLLILVVKIAHRKEVYKV